MSNEYEKNMKQVALNAIQVIGKLDAAPTEFSFGYVDENNTCRQGLVIKECAPIVISKLLENGFILSMRKDGLHVTEK